MMEFYSKCQSKVKNIPVLEDEYDGAEGFHLFEFSDVAAWCLEEYKVPCPENSIEASQMFLNVDNEEGVRKPATK